MSFIIATCYLGDNIIPVLWWKFNNFEHKKWCCKFKESNLISQMTDGNQYPFFGASNYLLSYNKVMERKKNLAHVSSATVVIANVIAPKYILTYRDIYLGYLKQRSLCKIFLCIWDIKPQLQVGIRWCQCKHTLLEKNLTVHLQILQGSGCCGPIWSYFLHFLVYGSDKKGNPNSF